MLKKIYRSFFILFVTSAFTIPASADVPPPPVNQTVGIGDGIFNNLVETECRFCHEDPDVAFGGSHIPNRHHNLINSSIQTGECSTTRISCLSNNECNPNICSRNNVACTVDADCPQAAYGEICGEVCTGETVAPDIDADQNGSNDTTYQCLNCHLEDTSGGIVTLQVWRDCLLCHVQDPGNSSIHHLTSTAQGTDSPIGDPNAGDCTPCHGTLVDDIGDGHAIPTYDPSLVTPSTRGGDGSPLNAYGNGAGACDYCHDQDAAPPTTPTDIYSNADTHHNAGVYISEYGFVDQNKCFWCHGTVSTLDIRVCENCHGYESLHNIALDSDTGCLLGDPGCEVVIGAESAGYSHVGSNDDCWGCHGFAQSAAPGSGPITPYLNNTDALGMVAGTDTAVTFSGSALTNLVGSYRWTSDVVMTASDGSSITLTPESITSNQLTITVPGTTPSGNYSIRAVKTDSAKSNPIVFAVIPEVVISDYSCDRKSSILTITGSGFGEKPQGTDQYINLVVDGEVIETLSWSDTEITASVSGCSKNVSIIVNALTGSASAGSGNGGEGKPPKPCKGAKCND